MDAQSQANSRAASCSDRIFDDIQKVLDGQGSSQSAHQFAKGNGVDLDGAFRSPNPDAVQHQVTQMLDQSPIRPSYYQIRVPNRICSERTNRICRRHRHRLQYPMRERINRQEGCSPAAIGRRSEFHSRIQRLVHRRPRDSCLAPKVNPRRRRLCLPEECCKIQVAISSVRPRRDRRSHLLHQRARRTRL